MLVAGFVQAQLKEGWSVPSIQVATDDCTQRIVALTEDALARRDGMSADLKATAVEQVRESSAAICGCIVRRAAETWPLVEWQVNFQAHLASMYQEAMAGGQCKPVAGVFGELAREYEGGTSRVMQEDFDRIRLDHAFVIGALIDEYRTKSGMFPFEEGSDTVPAVVVIGTPDQLERNKEFIRIRVDFDLRAANGKPAPSITRIARRTTKEFQDELERVLGRSVRLPVDPQQIPVNKPSIYIYVLYRGIYDVSVFLHQQFSFARPIGPYQNKVAIASRSYPPAGFWTADDLKREPQFVEFFEKPFNRAQYTLRTKL
jgi:hypothetical protein